MSTTLDFVMVKGARLSFPNIYKKGTFQGEENSNYDATLILDGEHPSHAKTIKLLNQQVKELVAGELKGKKPKFRYLCVKDDTVRADSNRPEYEGHVTIKASNKNRPVTIDQSGQVVAEDDNVFYSGCRVDVKIRLWANAGNYGPQVGANLIALRFAGDDEPLDGGHVTFDEAVDGFDVDEEDDDLFGGD